MAKKWYCSAIGVLLTTGVYALDLERTPPSSTAEAPAFASPTALSLNALFESVLASHPALQAARLQAHASEQEVGAAESLRWPTLAVTTESNRNGNNQAIAPTKLLTVEQALWDFGRVSSRIAEAEASAKVSTTQSDLIRQDLFLQVINAWQQLISGLEKQRVAERALGILRGYQAQMQRRVEAEVSTVIDLELVDARVLQTQVESMTARTQILQSITRLEQLSGQNNLAARIHDTSMLPDTAEVDAFASMLQSIDFPQVAREHASVRKAQQERDALEQRLSAKYADLKPQVYFRASKPLETTTFITNTTPSYFVGFRYTPAAGLAGHVEAQALATRLQGQDMSIEAAQLEILQSLLNDKEEFFNAQQRIQALDKSVKGAELVLESYLRQFQAGRKSWLDLLNTARDLAQNEYNLADAKIAMTAAMHRLKLRTGLSPRQP